MVNKTKQPFKRRDCAHIVDPKTTVSQQNTCQALVWLLPQVEWWQERTFFYEAVPSTIWTPGFGFGHLDFVLSLFLYLVFFFYEVYLSTIRTPGYWVSQCYVLGQ